MGLDGKIFSFCTHLSIGYWLDRFIKVLHFVLKISFLYSITGRADTGPIPQLTPSLQRYRQCLVTQFKVTYYPFKVWLTTIIVAPFLQSIFILFYHDFNSVGDFIPSLFSLLLFSFLFSLPSFLFYYLIVFFLEKYQVHGLLVKCIGAILAIVFMLMTYYSLQNIMSGDINHPKTIFFLFAYSICIALSSLLYNLTSQHSL